MYVINRKGQKETVSYNRILQKLKRFSGGLNVDCEALTSEIVSTMHPGIKTSQIDRHASRLAYAKAIINPDYMKLSSTLYVDNMHKMTTNSFSEMCKFAQHRVDINGDIVPILNAEIYNWIQANATALDNMVLHENDFLFGFPALQMAEETYLIKLNFIGTKPLKINDESKEVLRKIEHPSDSVKRVLNQKPVTTEHVNIYGYECEDGKILIDRPQYALLRVAIQQYWDQENALNKIKYSYDLMSQLYFTHPTPALINSCRDSCQLFSCFIVDTPDDLHGIYSTLNEVADISKRAGGMSVCLSNVRSHGQLIRTTNGMTSEHYKMLKLFDNTAIYVNQGGVRPGNIAIYQELHHPDILSLIELRDPSAGEIDKKTLKLFYGMWCNDLFFKRLVLSLETKQDVMWSLFDPDATPGLNQVHGEEYEKLYSLYEKKELFKAQIPVHIIFNTIVRTIYNVGNPYTCQKDAVNFKSNHRGFGNIKASNLCTEINELFDADRPACCVLASSNFARFVFFDNIIADGYKGKLLSFSGSLKEARVFFSRYFNFDKLAECTKLIVHNLNQCIMKNKYPIDKLRKHNIDYKPLAIGCQGLSKAFQNMRVVYDSEEGRMMNLLIFETVYFAALEASMEDVAIYGKYKDFEKSPLGQGLFQFDLWQDSYEFKGIGDDHKRVHKNTNPFSKYYQFDREKNLTLDWDGLRTSILKNGVANSLLTSLMPTVSTSVFMNNADSESFEPFNTFFLQKVLLYGTTIIFNESLYRDLVDTGLWNETFYNAIKDNYGLIDETLNERLGGIIPDWIIKLYRSVWSDGMAKVMIDRSKDRGAYVCQSQSFNLYIRESDKTFKRIHNALIYAWKCGLKTTSYYIRSKLKPDTSASKIGLIRDKKKQKDSEDKIEMCKLIYNEDGTTSKTCCSG
jgi:ribonucleoside-diphosphate reductase alpha chain